MVHKFIHLPLLLFTATLPFFCVEAATLEDAQKLINDVYGCDSCSGAIEETTVRGTIAIQDEYRVQMQKWKSEAKRKYPDSIWSGAAEVKVFILPNGKVDSAFLVATTIKNKGILSDVFKFYRNLKFRKVSMNRIDSVILPIYLE